MYVYIFTVYIVYIYVNALNKTCGLPEIHSLTDWTTSGALGSESALQTNDQIDDRQTDRQEDRWSSSQTDR